MTRKKILIIGANGFTGRRILNDLSLKQEYIVSGVSLHDDVAPHSGNYQFISADICQAGQLDRIFNDIEPDVVINTSALSVPDYCEVHHKEANLLNIIAVENLARHCQSAGSYFIHLSTDFVFGGEANRLYTEEDPTQPVNYYGYTKMEGEKLVQRHCSKHTIVRVAVVYGTALPGQHGNVLQLVADRLRKHEEVRVVSDQWRTPTFVGDVSLGIEKLIARAFNKTAPAVSSIYHICGNECLTIAEIAYRVATILGLDKSLIHPVTTQEMQEKTPRPRFSGMSTLKAQKELDYTPLSLDKGIKEMFESL
ncbi:NAD(P)-dependent oxidoreductase [Bacteroidaceae bacterium HV4-6-C5C]|nr:NAD(P)-dependent oxidoreductase [Bacteroidaceae bacterium HV4-6-C5C]